jgi:hypothetical protein
MYLLLIASLSAYVLGCVHLGIGLDGMSDGGGLHHFR